MDWFNNNLTTDSIIVSSTVSAAFFVGDGSGLTGVTDTGSVTLDTAQTITGQKTFVGTVEVKQEASAPILKLKRLNGTEASPTAISIAEPVAVIQSQGYNGSAFQNARNNIIVAASENWTPTANGTFMNFQVVTNGTTDNRIGLRIFNDTSIIFGQAGSVPSLVTPITKTILSQLVGTGAISNTLYVEDGTRNRRVGFFLDDTNNLCGLNQAYSSGGAVDFVLQELGVDFFRVKTNGDVLTSGRLIGRNLGFKSNATISHTGTTAETIVYSQLLPIGTFEPNDFLRIYMMLGLNTNNANVKTARVYFNTSNTLAGATLIATRTLTSTLNTNLVRTMAFKNSLSSQDVFPPSSNLVSDEALSNTSLSTISVDFALAQYFIVTLELADSGDTAGLRYFTAEIKR
jgi:hypothetical protein